MGVETVVFKRERRTTEKHQRNCKDGRVILERLCGWKETMGRKRKTLLELRKLRTLLKRLLPPIRTLSSTAIYLFMLHGKTMRSFKIASVCSKVSFDGRMYNQSRAFSPGRRRHHSLRQGSGWEADHATSVQPHSLYRNIELVQL